MFAAGTLVNAAAVVAGSLIGGTLLPPLSQGTRTAVTKSLGLGVVVIGVGMAAKTDRWLVVLLAIGIGALVGEVLGLEERLTRSARGLETRLNPQHGAFARELVNITVLFCAGAMAITGALDDGLRGDPTILYAKSVLDGICAMLFATALGPGVALTAIPVLLYQGAITLAAGSIAEVASPDLIATTGATGGLLVLALGLNLTGASQFKVANLLPALVLAIILFPLAVWIESLGLRP